MAQAFVLKVDNFLFFKYFNIEDLKYDTEGPLKQVAQ